jgi:iron complex outermembrane receptor protein
MIRYVLNTLGSFRSALAVGVGLPFLVAASAYAQAPAPAPEATTERVIVTGSYIPTAETESALPVTVYTAEVLQKQGANTPIEGLRQLPSFVGNAATENDSNGGNGQANINLRALGTQNTITLINGRRAFEFSDINAIPISGLSRTEVLKDGASAVYGSDAVAGVVNFILLNGPGEKPYEGAELFALYGSTTDTDAHVRQIFLRGGVTGLDGKVSIAASGEYYSRSNLFSRDREISTTGDLGNRPNGKNWGGLNNNSPTYAGRVSVLANASGFPTGQLVLIDLTNSQVNANSYRPFEQAAGTGGTDPSRFNFRAFTPAIPAVEKAMYFVTGRYKVFGEGLQLYGDVMYSHTKQDNALAGSPFAITSAGNGRNEARASHFNPFGNSLGSVRYRTEDELGNRRSFYDHDYHRYVAGVNGEFNFKDNGFISRFGYDSGFVYETFSELRTDSGDATRTLVRENIAPVGFDANSTGLINPFVGQNAPKTGFAPTYVNGVPTGLREFYDNFTGFQNSAYLGHSLFYERDHLYDAKINAHLFPNIWNGGVDVAIGYEHRYIAQHQIPDPVQAAGDQLGFNAAPNTKYRQEVDSVFGELGIPIITSTMNVPFVRSLDFSFAYRYEKFTNHDNFNQNPLTSEIGFNNGGNPRLSLRYQPIPDLTLRASWGQSFRSPSPAALFDPGSQNFPVLFDPYKAVTLQPPGGVNQQGNAGLLPEDTDAYSAGIVYTPKWLPGFTMTVDMYQLFTRNVILSAPDFAQIVLTRNGVSAVLNNGTPTVFTDRVFRDATGNLVSIDPALTNNAAKRLVEGLDVTAVYEIPTERFGKFTLSGGYNHFFIWKAEADPTIARGATSFLGNYNNGTIPLAPGAIPWNKGFLRGEWEWKGLDFIATGNYIGDFDDDPAFSLGNRIVDGKQPANLVWLINRRVPSYITLDLQLSYEFKKPAVEAPPTYAKDAKDGKNVMTTEAASSSIWQRILWGTKFTVGVVDAFDRQPPSVLGAFNDNYDTSLYSIRNRYWYASMSKKF